MRRRFHRAGRRRKAMVAWQTPVNWANPVTVLSTAVATSAFLGVSTDSSGNPPSVNRFKLERLLGDLVICISPTIDPLSRAVILHMGIIVVEVGVSADPQLAADSDRPWLWLKHLVFPTVGCCVPSEDLLVSPPKFEPTCETMWMPNVDIRVKRVLKGDAILLLCMRATYCIPPPVEFEAPFVVRPYLRPLISKIV